MNSSSPIVKSIAFFDRDPEETMRLEAIVARRSASLDAKIEAYFEQRIANAR